MEWSKQKSRLFDGFLTRAAGAPKMGSISARFWRMLARIVLKYAN